MGGIVTDPISLEGLEAVSWQINYQQGKVEFRIFASYNIIIELLRIEPNEARKIAAQLVYAAEKANKSK